MNSVRQKREIPGTAIFDGDQARKGYALNKMCFSFNSAANREEFLRDERPIAANTASMPSSGKPSATATCWN
jgi:Aromatic-ring-opening dioxygenase LigAB, LigA subunit.